MKKLNLLSALIPLIFVTSCGTNEPKEEGINTKIEKLLSQDSSPIVFENEPTPAFITVTSPKDTRLNKMVSVAINRPINIIAAIDAADSTLSVSADEKVDLKKIFIVKFNNQSMGSYFKYLENITGYALELNDGVVYVRSTQFKTWNLQSLSMVDEVRETSAKKDIKSDKENDVSKTLAKKTNWTVIINHVKNIMNGGTSQTISTESASSQNEVKQGSNKQTTTFRDKTPVVVTDNQQLGTISAFGLPNRIQQVDKWIKRLINASNRQIHLQVQVLDVIVDDSAGQGINWNLISKQSSQIKISNTSQQSLSGAGITSIGTVAGTVIDLGKKISLDFMLNLLRKQGKVKVSNQPNITVTNGREAYITTGDEFSYVESIDAQKDAQGQVTITSNVERMSVGVDMRVTPKILEDGRIVVKIVPVISSVKSFTTLTTGKGDSLQKFETPNIALQKLTTQVIVDSGKTIHLGGLIASKVASASKGLPGGGWMDFMFKGRKSSLERREVVILITPTIVR